MKKYIIFFVTSICLILLFSSIVYAYYSIEHETSDVIIETGTLKYRFDDVGFKNNFIEKELIVPGEELIKNDSNVYIINESTISSNLRIVIKVTVNEASYYLTSNKDSEIIGELDSNWTYNSTDECWYYLGVDGEVLSPSGANTFTNINILSSIKLNGNYFGNTVASKDVEITIIYQAKQKEFATWDNIGEINKNLGN